MCFCVPFNILTRSLRIPSCCTLVPPCGCADGSVGGFDDRKRLLAQEVKPEDSRLPLLLFVPLSQSDSCVSEELQEESQSDDEESEEEESSFPLGNSMASARGSILRNSLQTFVRELRGMVPSGPRSLGSMASKSPLRGGFWVFLGPSRKRFSEN